MFRVFNALGQITFAFAGHAVALEIQATIPSTPEKPSRIPMWKGAIGAYFINAICYFPVAFVGYWAFGQDVDDNVLMALKRPAWLIASANLMVVIHVIGSYQVWFNLQLVIYTSMHAIYIYMQRHLLINEMRICRFMQCRCLPCWKRWWSRDWTSHKELLWDSLLDLLMLVSLSCITVLGMQWISIWNPLIALKFCSFYTLRRSHLPFLWRSSWFLWRIRFCSHFIFCKPITRFIILLNFLINIPN